MWRERIIEAKKAKGITTKMLAERTPSHITTETITRILKEKTDDPRISTVLALCEAVELSPWELFADAAVVVAYQSFVALQAEVDALKAEREAIAEENAALKDKVCKLSSENELLQIKLEHKEEIISLHNYYNKLK